MVKMNILALFLVLLLSTCGCVTRIETNELPHPEAVAPRSAPSQTEGKTVSDKRVAIDPALEKVIRIVGIKSSAGADGYLKIQLNVQNQTSSPKEFTYQIDWFDQDGMALPMAASAPLAWTLLSHETSFLAAAAPTPAAKDFRVTFLAR